METKWTLRRFFGSIALGLGCTLVILSMATLVAANGGGPTVDGRYTGDEANYFVLGSADGGRGTLYYNRVGNTLYLLMRVDDSVNDNVFGKSKKDSDSDADYVKSAGWVKPDGKVREHHFGKLYGSDRIKWEVSCGDQSRNWEQDYLRSVPELKKDNEPHDPNSVAWFSDEGGDGSAGSGTLPLPFESHSSLEWNMENTNWDVTLGGTRAKKDDWKSPDPLTDYPGFDETDDWEWAMVYEIAMDVSACGNNDITVSVPWAHNSPPKDGDSDVPVCPDGCPLQGLGDYVWWDEDGEGDQDEDPANGLDDVIVELYSGSCPPTGDPIATDTTSGGGYYYFGSLEPGQYCVKLADSNFEAGGALYEYRALTDRDATDDTLDSDFDNTTHTSWTVTLAAGEENLTIDAGVEHTGPPTAVTLSSFDAKSSAGGWASPLWLGLAGFMVLVAGSLFWAKRRAG